MIGTSLKTEKKSQKPLWWIKWTKFEYWPWWFFYLPTYPYWLYLAIKTRSIIYFTAANPGIEYGGFFGESKIKILDLVPEQYLPQTLFLSLYLDQDEALEKVQSSGFRFPVILKPNIGERGTAVAKIENELQFEDYWAQKKGDIIVQEFITFPIELGVLYYRYPDGSAHGVSSVTMKEFMAVTGNGQSTVKELMLAEDRFRFQLESVLAKNPTLMTYKPANGEKVLLEPIGNHCRGTKFLNGQELINLQLDQVFGEIASKMDGFFFGRFDMKVSSIEDLYQGKNIKIMEVNGTTSEPAHIYDPNYTVWKAYKDVFYHMKLVSEISVQNMRRGVLPTPKKEFWDALKKHFLS